MPAALVAGDVQYLADRDMSNVARGQQLVVFRDYEESRALQGRHHLRDRNAGQAELRGERIHAPASAAGDVRATDEVHEAQRELLELDAGELQLLQAEPQVRR